MGFFTCSLRRNLGDTYRLKLELHQDNFPLFWHSFWHIIWKHVWHVYTDILSDILFDILSGINSDILSGIYSDIISDILSGVLSWIILTFCWALWLARIWTSRCLDWGASHMVHSRRLPGSWEKMNLINSINDLKGRWYNMNNTISQHNINFGIRSIDTDSPCQVILMTLTSNEFQCFIFFLLKWGGQPYKILEIVLRKLISPHF